MKVVTDYDGCRYITADKAYDAKPFLDYDSVVILIDDEGSEILTRTNEPSGHLDFVGVFRVVTEGEEEVMSDELFQGFKVGQQFIVNDPEEMGVFGEYSVGDVMTVVEFEMDGCARDQYTNVYPSGWVNKGYLSLVEAPEVHVEDATGRFWCDSTDRSYDTLEEALIDQAFYDWAELCIEFREDQRETGALLLDYVPDSVKRKVALEALGITDGGEV